MVRQCAWCLRLINNAGERLSSTSLPKLYEASHGICRVCGMLWIKQVGIQEHERTSVDGEEAGEMITQRIYPPQITVAPDVTELILQLQHEVEHSSGMTHVIREKPLRTV